MRGSHVVSLVVLVSAGLASAAARPASAVPDGPMPRRVLYWACETGYQLQTSSGAVRCYRAPSTQAGSLLPCLVGFRASTDFDGNRDWCKADTPVTGGLGSERACAPGYSKRVVEGTDRCSRTIPSDAKAPSVTVDR